MLFYNHFYLTILFILPHLLSQVTALSWSTPSTYIRFKIKTSYSTKQDLSKNCSNYKHELNVPVVIIITTGVATMRRGAELMSGVLRVVSHFVSAQCAHSSSLRRRRAATTAHT